MLNKIALKNFKCFKNNTEIELAPLTILCGTNSSGKSSIMKSLLMIKQTVESKSPDVSAVLAGALVDNGTFNDVVYNGTEKSFEIEHNFEINNPKLYASGIYIKKQDAKAFNELRRIYYSEGEIICKFLIRLRVIIQKQVMEENEFSQYIADNNVKEYQICISAYDKNGNIIKSCDSDLVFKNRDNKEKHFLSWNNIPGYSKAKNSWENYQCICSFNGLVITSVFAYNMPNSVKSIIPNILTLVRVTFSQYEGIKFIAPLRQTPERTYLIRGNIDSVGLSGENTAMLLAKLKDKKLINDFTFKNKDGSEFVSNKYLDIIQYWLDYFHMGKLKISGNKGAISVTLDAHNISDVGFGVSQILPIITQGIYMNKEETLLIEQPEIHLHPKMELSMADFLIELARSGRNVVAETHSDHIINRIIHRVMENYDELSKIVKIYFVENAEQGSIIHSPIDIDKYKGTKIEYEDFFTQYTSESREIVCTGLKNMMEKKE